MYHRRMSRSSTVLSFVALAITGLALAGCPDEKKSDPATSATGAATPSSSAPTDKAAPANSGSGW